MSSSRVSNSNTTSTSARGVTFGFSQVGVGPGDLPENKRAFASCYISKLTVSITSNATARSVSVPILCQVSERAGRLATDTSINVRDAWRELKGTVGTPWLPSVGLVVYGPLIVQTGNSTSSTPSAPTPAEDKLLTAVQTNIGRFTSFFRTAPTIRASLERMINENFNSMEPCSFLDEMRDLFRAIGAAYCEDHWEALLEKHPNVDTKILDENKFDELITKFTGTLLRRKNPYLKDLSSVLQKRARE